MAESTIADKNGRRDGSLCDGYEKSPTRNRCLYLNYDTKMCWAVGLEK